MTAINPARLKIQSADLCQHYSNPGKFISGLHDLLEFYASRIRQTSLARTPLSLQTYQVPPPVLRALITELESYLGSDPDTGLTLIDAIWEEEWLEFRQVAIISLGKLPPDDPKIILDRSKAWLESCTAEEIRRKIMTRGLERMAEEKPEDVFGYINDLIRTGLKKNHQAALFGLLAFAKDLDFDNLPLIYNQLAKILKAEESGLVKEITSILAILGKRSEQETAYFLERQLAAGANPRIIRVTRQVMGKFNPSNQMLLRNAIDQD